MDEFDDELVLEREKKRFDLEEQERHNQLKHGHAETHDQASVSCDTDGFVHSLWSNNHPTEFH